MNLENAKIVIALTKTNKIKLKVVLTNKNCVYLGVSAIWFSNKHLTE